MQIIGENENRTSFTAFTSLINNPVKFRLFLLRNLPAAWFSGVKINQVNEQSSEVSIPYKWFTRNPFRSTYFACLGMAAEMSTGVLAMASTYRRTPKISMLVTRIEGNFYKKATGRVGFICTEGTTIKQAIEKTANSNESQVIRVRSSGFNKENELIAEFWITWSFKVKP